MNAKADKPIFRPVLAGAIPCKEVRLARCVGAVLRAQSGIKAVNRAREGEG